MLTGTIPPYHGVRDNGDYYLDDAHVTLPEVLQQEGFATGAIIGAFVLDSRYGLDQGFDTYDDQFDEDSNSPFGLPKIRVHHSRAGTKSKKAEAKPVEEGAPAEGETAEAAAAPEAKADRGKAKS